MWEQLTVQLGEKDRTELRLNIPVGDADTAFIVARLSRQPNISSVVLKSYVMGDEGAKEFAGLLKGKLGGDGVIKRLVLSGVPKKDTIVQKVRGDGAEKGVIKLARALANSTTLRHLDLSNNGIGQKGMLAIVEALTHNTTLKTLDLSGNAVNLPIAKALAASLSFNLALKKLVLRNCKMTADGVMVLLSCLRFNRTLVSLVVPQNSILPKLKMQKVLSLVSINRLITTLDLGSLEKVGFSVLRIELERNSAIQLQMKAWKGISEPKISQRSAFSGGGLGPLTSPSSSPATVNPGEGADAQQDTTTTTAPPRNSMSANKRNRKSAPISAAIL